MEQKTEEKTIWDRIGSINYKYIYVFAAILLFIPIVQPLGIPMKVSDLTKVYYNTIMNLPPHSYVLFQNWVDLSVWADTGPILIVTLEVLWTIPQSQDIKIVMYQSLPDGTVKMADLLKTGLTKPPQWRIDSYGTSWVDMGYCSFPNEATYASFVLNFGALVTKDSRGTPLMDIPIMKELAARGRGPPGIVTAGCFDLLVWGSWGCTDPDMWVRQFWVSGNPPFHLPMLMMSIGNCVPNIVPYVGPDKPIRAFIAGSAGAAELEVMMGFKGDGTKMADATDLGGVATVILVVIGNIAYIGGRYLVKKKEV